MSPVAQPLLDPCEPGFPSREATGVSDTAVLFGYGDSEPEAAAEFVRRFQRRVYGLALVLVGDARVAEDVSQEALLRAWHHASDFDARRGSVTNWLLTITRNLAIDTMRRRRPIAVAPNTLADRSPSALEPDPGDVVASSDDVTRLRHALLTLPGEQRRAVVLAGMWGLTGREIAAREGIPIGTAKTRIRLALLRLRAVLVDCESSS
jgi:RNA polymerase sigma-70 factor (ECF subfamily)